MKIIEEFKESRESTYTWLRDKYSSLRSGNAQISMIDGIEISQYGEKQSIKNVASITKEGMKTLVISPWDKGIIGDIESAIMKENLGLSISSQDNLIRVNFPDLTGETRDLLIKRAKDILEEAKISLRVARDKIWNNIQKMEKDKEISENEKFSLKEKLQKEVDEGNKELDSIYNAKAVELNN